MGRAAWRRVAPDLSVRHPRRSTRRDVDVLLLDAQFRQALVAARSLGVSGLSVATACCEAQARWAPAAHSRWVDLNAVVPDITTNAKGYVDGVLRLLDECPARVMIPGHDGSIATLRTHRRAFETRTALALASEAALDVAADKMRTLDLARHLGIDVPRSIFVADPSEVKAALDHVGCPAVVKPTIPWARSEGIGTRLFSMGARTLDEAKRRVDNLRSLGGQALIQEWLPGRRDAVSVFMTGGRFWARFAQASRREHPPLGGSTVFCESIPLLPDITEPSERLVREMKLEGCSMIEYRRDRQGRPVLMEVNARMGGSVQLAQSCGVDFPKLLYAWATGEPLSPVGDYAVGRKLRWLGGEIRALRVIFRDHGQLDVPSRGKALAVFVSDFVLNPSRFDVIDWRDPKPAFVEAAYMLNGATRVLLGAPVAGETEGTAA